MAYNNYFPMGYQQYYPQPQYNAFPQPVDGNQQTLQGNAQQAHNTPQNGIIWVSGEAGARGYPVAPNQTVELWDTESQTIYLKSADASGMPSIRILDYTYRESAPKHKETLDMGAFATKEDVDYLKGEIASLRANIEEREGKKK